jgi:glycosyltransferase involved in cell wall biosynthesis
MLSKKQLIIFIPSIESGGVEKNLFIISNYLSKKISNISIITSNNIYKRKFDKKINIIYPKIKFFQNTSRFKKILICSFLLIIEIFKNKKITILSFQANIYAILICKIFNISVIARTNSAAYFHKSNFFKNYIFSKILKKADKIIVNSIELKKKILNKYKISSIHIYNPLDIKKILHSAKKNINNNFFEKKTTNIIHVGRLTDQKDQITIFKAVNEIKDKINIRLLILGQGKDQGKLKNYIHKNKLKNIIKIKKFIQNPYPLIKSADLFILSSKFEGLPNVLLEAVALNKFIISTNCPTGPREILCNGKAGLLFKPENYLELAKKILFFKYNYNLCQKKMITAKYGLGRFDYNINLYKYLKLVKSELTI